MWVKQKGATAGAVAGNDSNRLRDKDREKSDMRGPAIFWYRQTAPQRV